MKNDMQNGTVFATIVGAMIVFGGAIWFTTAVWSECRAADHSWFYCLRMIQR